MRKISFIYLFVVFSIPVFAQKTTLPVVTSPKFKKDTLSIKKFGAIVYQGVTPGSKITYLGVILCEKSIARIPEA